MSDELTDEIAAAALRPQSTSVDGETIIERPLRDLHEQDKFNQNKQMQAAIEQGGWPLKTFGNILPGGR